MGTTSYSLRPLLCSSSYVSRVVRNEGLTTAPIKCFHVPNFFHEVDGIYSSDGFMGPTSYPLGPICVQAMMYQK